MNAEPFNGKPSCLLVHSFMRRAIGSQVIKSRSILMHVFYFQVEIVSSKSRFVFRGGGLSSDQCWHDVFFCSRTCRRLFLRLNASINYKSSPHKLLFYSYHIRIFSLGKILFSIIVL